MEYEVWEMADALVENLGYEEAFNQLVKALPDDTAREMFEFIFRMNGIDLPEEE